MLHFSIVDGQPLARPPTCTPHTSRPGGQCPSHTSGPSHVQVGAPTPRKPPICLAIAHHNGFGVPHVLG